MAINPYSPQALAYYNALAAQKPPSPTPFQYQGLMPSQQANYAVQRAQANMNLGQTQAKLKFDQGQNQQLQTQDFADLARKWDETRNNLPGSFLHRGLYNSGIYGTALQNYGAQRVAATGALTQKYQGLQQGNQLAGQQAQDTYGTNMGGIASQEAAARADLAAQIKNL